MKENGSQTEETEKRKYCGIRRDRKEKMVRKQKEQRKEILWKQKAVTGKINSRGGLNNINPV